MQGRRANYGSVGSILRYSDLQSIAQIPLFLSVKCLADTAPLFFQAGPQGVVVH